MDNRERAVVQQRRRHSESAAAEYWQTVRQHVNKRHHQEKIRLVRGKYLCLVTGAGNGLGRALSGLTFQDQGIFPSAMSGSRLILVDCNEDDLKETSGKKMRQFLKHRKIEVELIVKDLSDIKEAETLMQRIDETYDKDFEHVIFLNHATSLGDVSKTLLQQNISDLKHNVQLNILSRVYLTSEFCRIFSHSKKTIVHTLRFHLEKPTPNLGLNFMAHNAIKAFGQTLATENPTINVMLYTVNMIETSKTKTILENCENATLKEEIAQYQEENMLNAPLEAAKRLTKFLEEKKFIPGEVMTVNDEKCHKNGELF